MAEKTTNSIESHESRSSDEQLEKIADQQKEALREKLERAEKDHGERQSEINALNEARKLAHDSEESDDAPAKSPAERRRGPISKKQLENSFASQMSHAREHMNPASRAFSNLIHAKAVEKVSDTLGATVARPNALLSGSIAAFLAITILYFMAKYYGFELSGFETIGAFIVGWIIGVLYDYFALMIRGHK